MPSGLMNVGGTCYLNSVLQALHASNALAAAGGRDTFSSQNGASTTAEELAEVLALLAVNDTVIGPNKLLQHLDQALKGADFCVRRQNDPHEFYVLLTDRITHGLPPSSPLARAFYGQAVTTFTCNACGAKYTNKEPFSSLLLDLPADESQAVALEDLIKAHLTPLNANDGGGTWRCDRCSQRGQPVTRSIALRGLPSVLAITLCRYGPDGRKRLTPVTAPSCLSFPSKKQKYRLAAVCHHIGGSGHSGHCLATTLQKDGSWTSFDDASIATGQTHGGDARSAYMIFYSQIACD